MSVSELYERVVELEAQFALNGEGQPYSDRLLALLDRIDAKETPATLNELVDSLREKVGAEAATADIDGKASDALAALEQRLGGHSATSDKFAEFQKKVEGTNINGRTLLATDYLNHFNEIVMTLDLVPDMPELIEDAKEWAPKSYKDHFLQSSVADNELAAEAYDHVPPMYREPFDMTINQIERLIANAIAETEADIQKGNIGLLSENTSVRSRMIQKAMDTANAIIAGHEVTLNQAEIDSLLDGADGAGGNSGADDKGAPETLDQSAVDSMFP